MRSDSIPLKLLVENLDQGLVCVHMHSITKIQKILTFMI